MRLPVAVRDYTEKYKDNTVAPRLEEAEGGNKTVHKTRTIYGVKCETEKDARAQLIGVKWHIRLLCTKLQKLPLFLGRAPYCRSVAHAHQGELFVEQFSLSVAHHRSL